MGSESEYHQVVWLATFSDSGRRAEKHRTKQKFVNKEAEAEPFISTKLAGIEVENHVSYHTHISGHEIVGLVILSPWAQHQALLPLDDEMRSQRNFWSLLSGGSLDGQLFYFKAVKAEATRFGVPLAETHTGRTTCFFHLDAVWAERSFSPAEAAAGSVARAEPEEENPADELCVPEHGARTVRRDRGFKWGDHFITPVGDDDDPKHYQITCGFSCHNIAGKCTKKRSVKFGGKDKVLLCLKWVSLPRHTFTLEALGVNCDTGVPEQLAATARLHILRCLLRLATLSERLPHLGTGINAWEKIDRETQGSRARRDLR